LKDPVRASVPIQEITGKVADDIVAHHQEEEY